MRLALALVLAAPLSIPCLSCRRAEAPETPSASAPAQPRELAGTWEVDGVTTERRTGAQRAIGGRIVITLAGEGYASSFHLATQFPTPDGPVAAEVIGKGDGSVSGTEMAGRAETQIVLGSVPGVDSGFAFVPRSVSTRIVSRSTARLAPDGSLVIEIESEPAPGETYASTRTTLRGHRLGGVELGADAPPVASPPPSP